MKPNDNKAKYQIHGNSIKKCNRSIVVPKVKRYFFICPDNIVLQEAPYTINADQFVDDEGDAVQSFRTFGSSGYTNLFINGVMQQSGIYQISSDSLQLNITGEIIYKGTPIIIEAIGFRIEKK